MEYIPWQEMMQYASLFLNIKPNEFWKLTMLEFMILIQRNESSRKHITREELEYLIKKFE